MWQEQTQTELTASEFGHSSSLNIVYGHEQSLFHNTQIKHELMLHAASVSFLQLLEIHAADVVFSPD